MGKEVNITEVLSAFDLAVDKLEADFQPQLLSKQEQINIDEELKSVIRLGLKVKLQFQQRKIEALIKSLEGNQEIDLIKVQLMCNELNRILKMGEAA